MQHKGEAELLSLKGSLRRSWRRHNLLANKRAISHLYHCTSQVEDKDRLISAWGLARRDTYEKRDSPVVFPWGVEVNQTQGLTWLLLQLLEHSWNKIMTVHYRKTPTTTQIWPAPLAFPAILLTMRWKIKTMLSYSTPPPPPPVFSSHSCITAVGNDCPMTFKRSPWAPCL